MNTLTSTQDLDGLAISVEYIYTPGEAEEGPESRFAGPAVGASAVVIGVQVCNASGHGVMVDPSFMNADVIADWESKILEEMQ